MYDVILHMPTDNSKKQELKDKATAVHIDAIISYLNRLNSPKIDKLRLLQTIKDDVSLSANA